MGKPSSLRALTSPAYVLSVAILLLNDHVLKEAVPGVVTGKLSDFAGLFAFAAFWASLFPRRALAVCLSAGGLFVVWKSPWVEPWISLWNARGAFPVARVSDWSDLTALAVLPLAYRLSVHPPESARRPAATAGIAVVSLVAFAATSVPHHHLEIPPDDPLRRVKFHGSVRQFLKTLDGCGYRPHLENGPPGASPGTGYLDLSIRIRPGRPKETFSITATVRVKRDRILLEFEDATLFRPREPVDDVATLRKLREEIGVCLHTGS